MTHILVITGSRALVGSGYAEAAQRMLDATIAALPPDALLVTGDAGGPDQWSDASGAIRGIERRIYALDGAVYSSRAGAVGRSEEFRLRRWDHGLEDKREQKGWPLLRNRQMIRDCAREMARGAHVEAFGLRAMWSRTQGTAYTLRLAREAGFAVIESMFGGRT